MTVVVPGGLGRAVRLREGERGRRWLDGLPALVERVLRAWRCRPDGAVRHGQVAIVVPVRSDRHGPAVLKISYPSARTRHEVRALRSLDGRGAVRVYAVDEASHAVLLERAGPATLASVPSADHAIELAGALARTLAVPRRRAYPRWPVLRTGGRTSSTGRWRPRRGWYRRRWSTGRAPRFACCATTVRPR